MSNQGSRIHQAFVGIQAGKEAHVPILVRLQGHDGLLQLFRVGTAGLLKVRCTQNKQVRKPRSSTEVVLMDGSQTTDLSCSFIVMKILALKGCNINFIQFYLQFKYMWATNLSP